HVFEYNYNKAYKPFLDVYENFSDLPLGLHCSGPLWDWLLESHPEYIERLKSINKEGNIEFLGGAYYEPILSMIPEIDRAGQIKLMKDFLKTEFGQDPGGFWLTERVWEQELTSSLAGSGVEYTIVDDSHFINAGIIDEKLLGYFVTEDQGKLISVFGTNKKLRYKIPYSKPEELKDFFEEQAEKNPGALFVYGDDGEKFGGWPGTHEYIYKEKWLESFFTMLRENSELIKLKKPSDILKQIKPKGKLYIPDSSYSEMMEWALPAKTGHQYEHVNNVLKEQIIWGEASVFLRGGFWRNFKYKYPEANQMYARMMEISGKIQKNRKKIPEEAVKYLYQAQCNCPYWHGVFGGLYLNHLRFETYRNLIRADHLITESLNKNKELLITEEKDFDFDGLNEIAVQNKWHRIYFQPHGGGRIYEWDYFPAKTNLLDTMRRRYETYHQKIMEATSAGDEEDVQSIHDISKLKDMSLKDDLIYDKFERKSFLDHIITGEITTGLLRKNEINEICDLPLSEYSTKVKKSAGSVKVTSSVSADLKTNGGFNPIELNKTIVMYKNKTDLDISYNFTNNGIADLDCKLGLEWNFAMLAGDADDRYYFTVNNEKAGKLNSEIHKKSIERFGLADEWQKIKVIFIFNEPVELFTFPIETISQSESSYEKVYQSSVIYPVIQLNISPGKNKTFSYQIIIETI
ncbi:alpha-amylase/4-alpha-glucanotransferase domain-containing protein, partial [candidate division KSB1 bacterium]